MHACLRHVVPCWRSLANATDTDAAGATTAAPSDTHATNAAEAGRARALDGRTPARVELAISCPRACCRLTRRL